MKLKSSNISNLKINDKLVNTDFTPTVIDRNQ